MKLLGQEVRTLVDEDQPAGFYEVMWDGKDNNGQRVASGVYLYKLETRDFVQTRKMVLLQ
ncbi:MAG: FlgD immunoglobulin-like domain containing protein [bacterium]